MSDWKGLTYGCAIKIAIELLVKARETREQERSVLGTEYICPYSRRGTLVFLIDIAPENGARVRHALYRRAAAQAISTPRGRGMAMRALTRSCLSSLPLQ